MRYVMLADSGFLVGSGDVGGHAEKCEVLALRCAAEADERLLFSRGAGCANLRQHQLHMSSDVIIGSTAALH